MKTYPFFLVLSIFHLVSDLAIPVSACAKKKKTSVSSQGTATIATTGKPLIYFWEWRGTNSVGHLSLRLSDGTYISHWPDDGSKQKLKAQNASQMHSLDDDIGQYKRNPEKIVEIPASIIAETSVKVWWEEFVKTATYNLVTQNCAQVVKTALQMGGFLYEPMLRHRLREWSKSRGGIEAAVVLYKQEHHGTTDLTPADVVTWAEQYIKSKQMFDKKE